MLSDKDRGVWDDGPSTGTTVLADEPWLEKQGALVPQRLVTQLPIHMRALNSTAIEKPKLWLVQLLVSGFVLFGVVLDLWRFWQSQPFSSDSSEIRTSRDGADVSASAEDQLSDLQAAAKAFLEQGNLQEARRTSDAILIKDPQNMFALGLKEKIRRQRELGPAVPQPHRKSFVYPVIHDHFLGSCQGSLRIDSKSVAFVPTEDSKDGFSSRLTDIVDTDVGDKLRIRLKDRTYQFKAALAKNKKENRARLTAVHRQVAKLRAMQS